MAGSVNKVILIGNLGADPEVRQSNQDGSKIVTFSLATNESWRDKSTGDRREKTEWHRVVIFNDNLANVAEKFLKKGSKIYLEGQLQTRKWMDATQVERYTTEVVVPRFRGELTLLDRLGGGFDGSGEGYNQGAVGGSSGGSSSHGGNLGSRAGAPGVAHSGSREARSNDAQSHDPLADFNDDVPF